MAGRVLVVQHEDDCPPAWVGDWLVEDGCVLDVRRAYADDPLPADLGGHDALLVLGGAMGANDDAEHPWLTPTKELVRVAARDGVPTLGICLGHQLVAVALGGVSGPNPNGQQLGLVPLGWTEAAEDDDLSRELLGTGFGVHWNDDVVLRQPDGTVVLASAPRGELQVARFAPTVWGVQLHPEVDDRILATWAEDDRDRYDEGVLDAVLEAVAAAREELAAGWRPLARALSSLA
ncbi:MAG: glutamine amidotransferase class-I [Marmoricola sp.]|jgi:GMP synthase (glutamine-hydrolysing)|nr:glutamine amidotransferase class-I [Marmoricola sp.]